LFTYGPLGYLLSAANIGRHYDTYIVWQILSNAVFATVILLLGRSFAGGDLRPTAPIFSCSVAVARPGLCSDYFCTRPELPARTVEMRRLPTTVITLLLAILSLAKFINLILASFILLCVILHQREGIVGGISRL